MDISQKLKKVKDSGDDGSGKVEGLLWSNQGAAAPKSFSCYINQQSGIFQNHSQIECICISFKYHFKYKGDLYLKPP